MTDTKRCKVCGAEYTRRPGSTAQQWGKKVTCSRDCANRARQGRRCAPLYFPGEREAMEQAVRTREALKAWGRKA